MDQPAIEYVLDGDTELRAIERDIRAAEHAGDGVRLATLHGEYDHQGGYTANSRAAQLLYGLGFSAAQHVERGAGVLRRLAYAPESRSGVDAALRRLAARRTDQPSRFGRGAVAGRLPARLSRRAAVDFARPRVPGPRGRSRRAYRAGDVDALHRQLFVVRAAACRAAGRTTGRLCAAAARDRAHSQLHRSLQDPRVQSAPGAEPHESAGTHGADRAGARRYAVSVRVSRSAEDPQSALDAGARQRGVYASGRCSATRTCSWCRAIASGCSVRTARASRR